MRAVRVASMPLFRYRHVYLLLIVSDYAYDAAVAARRVSPLPRFFCHFILPLIFSPIATYFFAIPFTSFTPRYDAAQI